MPVKPYTIITPEQFSAVYEALSDPMWRLLVETDIESGPGPWPIGDMDVLILGEPDRDQLYAALGHAEERLGRPVQATIRGANWLARRSGAFHDTVTGRPLLRLDIQRV